MPTHAVSPVVRLLPVLWVLFGQLPAAASDSLADSLANGPQPSPALGPKQVVRTQLEALRQETGDDRGIAVAFRFASPQNQRVTGPLPRFASMIRNGPYALMLRYLDASYAPLQRDGDVARQAVTLVGSGEAMTFVFHLSRQVQDGALRDCWMTDAVTIAPSPGQPA